MSDEVRKSRVLRALKWAAILFGISLATVVFGLLYEHLLPKVLQVVGLVLFIAASGWWFTRLEDEG